jgi:CheY-like chemotaxis protein
VTYFLRWQGIELSAYFSGDELDDVKLTVFLARAGQNSFVLRDAADSLGMLLGMYGAQVRIVRDGPAALAALDTYRPDVMLLDIGMPGMDGYEVARRTREKPECRNLILIALSGWGQEEDRRLSKEAGIDHHLVKPVDVVALERLLVIEENRTGPLD